MTISAGTGDAQGGGAKLEQLEQAIAALDAQRAMLGDAVVDAALAPMRERLARLEDAARSPGPGDVAGPVEAVDARERRLVTILFADIVGSTSIGERMDPEEVAELVNGAFAIMTGAIDDAGGRVGRVMGDGMIAFFGAPIGHEDDPLRALRAACVIRDGVAGYGDRVAARGGPRVRVRVGLHTGRVFVGRIGGGTHGEYTVIGDAANTAARIEAAAPTGEVLISEVTARMVQGTVELEPVGALELKGKLVPVRAYVVADSPARDARMPRGVGRAPLPLVGRDAEMKRLLDAAACVRSEGRPRVVAIRGEAGIGKSCLLSEVRARLGAKPLESVSEAAEPTAGAPAAPDREALWLDARGEPNALARPHGILRDLVLGHEIAWADGDHDQAEGALQAAFGEGAALVGRLLGLGGADTDAAPDVVGGLSAARAGDARERALAIVGERIARIADAAGLLVVALDDLHWADEASMDALVTVRDEVRGAPVLFIGASRPVMEPTRGERALGPFAPGAADEVDADDADDAADGDDAASGDDGRRPDVIELGPLEEPDMRALARALIETAVTHRDGLWTSDGGSPSDDGALQAGSAEADGGAPSATTPDRTAPSAASPDRIAPSAPSPDDKALDAIVARAEGNPYFLEELLRLSGEDGDQLPATLVALLQARIDRLRPGDRDIVSRAAVIGRAFWDEALVALAADGAPPDGEGGRVRRTLDELVRGALVAIRPETAFEGTQELSFRNVLGRDVAYANTLREARRPLHARAAGWLEAQAGVRADDLSSEIADHLERADRAGAAAIWFTRAAEHARRAFANHEAIRACTRALACMDSVANGAGVQGEGDVGARFDLLAMRTALEDRIGDREAQAADIEAMAALAPYAGPAAIAREAIARCDYLWAIGDYGRVRQVAAAATERLSAPEAIDAIPSAERDRLTGLLLKNVGRAARDQGDYVAADEALRAAAERFEAAGAAHERANALVQIGALASERGDFEEAHRWLDEALEASKTDAALPARAWALDNLSIVCASQGDFGQALQYGEEALALARRYGGRRRELTNRINTAVIASLLGRFDVAGEHAAAAQEVARVVRDSSGEVLATLALGDVASAEGRHDDAVALLEYGLERARALDRALLRALGLSMLARALVERGGDGDAARAEAIAGECIGAAAAAGLDNYRIVGLATRADARRLLGDLDGAVSDARSASAALAEGSGIEEPEQIIHFALHRALDAAGLPGASSALAEAATQVRRQSERIADPADRAVFLERVPINRRVLAAARADDDTG